MASDRRLDRDALEVATPEDVEVIVDERRPATAAAITVELAVSLGSL